MLAIPSPRELALLNTAHLSALTTGDLVQAHTLYRFLLRTKLGGLRAYVKAPRAKGAFEKSFGMTPNELQEEFANLLAGG